MASDAIVVTESANPMLWVRPEPIDPVLTTKEATTGTDVTVGQDSDRPWQWATAVGIWWSPMGRKPEVRCASLSLRRALRQVGPGAAAA